ncbi:MAG: TonB family protein [Bdellovibrionales bacterium]|nr:TonB family protein [Bdellovibrionales bacterium]
MSKNIKIFIYVSLFIHLSAGVALYMYYFNPSAPQPLGKDKIEELQPEATLNSPKAVSGKALQARKRFIDKTKPVKSKVSSVKSSGSHKKSSPKSQKPVRVSPRKAGTSKEQARISLDSKEKTKEAQNLSTEEDSLSGSKISTTPGKDKNEKTPEGKAVSADTKTGDVLKDKTPAGEEKAPVSPPGAITLSGEGKKETVKPEEKSQPPLPDSSLGKPDLKTEAQKLTTKTSKTANQENPLSTDQTGKEESQKSLPDSTTKKAIPDNKDQKISPDPSNPLQTAAVTVKEKEQDTSADLKQSASLPKFRDFLDIKQKRGNPKLDYPYEAREKKMYGKVSIIYFVTPEGLVDQIQLEKSSGHSLLDNFVLRTVARYEFFPQQEGWIRHTVDFILKGEEVQNLKLRKGE